VVYTLWQNFLRFDPDDPIWPNRDRLVLSNGHASMLLYAVLHLSGVKVVNGKYERLCEPVSVTYRTGLRRVETENGKWRAETGDRNSTVHHQSLTIAGQRLGRAYLARPNVGGFPAP
jgi:hypothetical protein